MKVELSDKVRFEIAVSDEFVEPTVGALCEGARTGEVGDGKIFVVPLEQATPCRTAQRAANASSNFGMYLPIDEIHIVSRQSWT